jgi:hypothetical protein
LDDKCKKIEELSDLVRLYRHKLLAHADKVECLKENTDLGEKIPIKLVRELLEQIADFLNTFDCEQWCHRKHATFDKLLTNNVRIVTLRWISRLLEVEHG